MHNVTVIRYRYSVIRYLQLNEQGDAGAQAVALLQQLVQQQHDQACNTVLPLSLTVIVIPLFTAE
jgi:hypothetical protein